MEGPALDLQKLQEISFVRCKEWGEMLQKCESKEEEESEINWSDVSSLYKDGVEMDGNDDNNAPNEAVESDDSEDASILKDVTNFSRVLKNFSGFQRNSIRHTQLELPVANSTTAVDHDQEQELRNLLDETLPVLQEHKRRMKESGIDRVLNTFDPKKVEEKVGSWLRHQNGDTAYAAHSYHVRPVHRTPSQLCRHADYQRYPAFRSGSESDSLHSVDTARYIRSSRKKHAAHRKLASGSSMTIKTFRLVKSKRDNLRQKYTVRVDADEEEALSAHRRCASHRKQPLPKYTDFGVAAGSHAIVKRLPQRNKVLRKRRSITHRYELADGHSSSCYTSDDDDNHKHNNVDNAGYVCCARSAHQQQLQKQQNHHMSSCKCNHSRRQMQCQSLCCRRSRGRVCLMSSFTSSSSTSFVDNRYTTRITKHKRSSMHLDPLQGVDYRPWRRESDCDCCNQEMLCSGVRHMADISTESWLVENYESPRKALSSNVRHEQPNKVLKSIERNYKTFRSPRYSESSPEIAEKRSHTIRSQKQNHKFDENYDSSTKPQEKPQKPQKKSNATGIKKSRKLQSSGDDTDVEYTTTKTTARKTSTKKVQEKANKKDNQLDYRTEDEDFLENLQLAIKNSKISFQRETAKQTKEDIAVKPIPSGQNTDLDSVIDKKIKWKPSDCSTQQTAVVPEVTEKPLRPQPTMVKHKTIANDLDVRKVNSKDPKDAATIEQTKHKSVQLCSSKSSGSTCRPLSDMTELTYPSLQPPTKFPKQSKKMAKDPDIPIEKSKRAYTEKSKVNKQPEQFANGAQTNNKSVELCSPKSSGSTCPSNTQLCDITALTEQSLKPQPKSAKHKKLSKLLREMTTSHSMEDVTYMRDNERVYNSTAIGANDCTAVKRQLDVENVSSANIKEPTPTPRVKNIPNCRNTDSNGKGVAAKKASTSVEMFSTQSDGTSSTASANDCTVVSSTTGGDPIKSRKGILLYAPDYTAMAPEQSIRDGYFHITEEHLGRVVGEQAARKFMKYHIGRKKFDCNKTRVYFKPPPSQIISDSDSEVDVFERVERYGQLFVTIGDSGRDE